MHRKRKLAAFVLLLACAANLYLAEMPLPLPAGSAYTCEILNHATGDTATLDAGQTARLTAILRSMRMSPRIVSNRAEPSTGVSVYFRPLAGGDDFARAYLSPTDGTLRFEVYAPDRESFLTKDRKRALKLAAICNEAILAGQAAGAP